MTVTAAAQNLLSSQVLMSTCFEVSVVLPFGDDEDAIGPAVQRLAEIAHSVNERQENIGARRLSTVLERLLDTLSFDASERSGSAIEIDGAYVDEHLSTLARNEDLSRYIL